MKTRRNRVMVNLFFPLGAILEDWEQQQFPFSVCLHPCPVSICPFQDNSELLLLFMEICFMCSVTVSHIVLLIPCFFPPFLPPPLHYVPPCPLCCTYVCICFFFFFLWGLCLPLLAEGDYCPWDRELQSGLWLEKYLTDEEDVGTFKGSSRTACGCVCSNSECDF